MSEDSSRSIIQTAKSFFYGTFLSRVVGMVRDMTLAFFFGSSPGIAAFMISFRFANLLRRLIGEGTLTSGFIPHFETIRKEDTKKAALFFRDLFFTMFILTGLLVAILELFLLFFRKYVPYAGSSYEILTLTMIMLPSLVCITLYALNSALLQCLKSYFLPSFAPVLFNLVWIFSMVILRGYPTNIAITGLSIAIGIAFIAQWLFTQVPANKFFVQNLKFSEWFKPKLFSQEIKKLYKPLTLSIIGVGAVQINSALDAIFARISDPSGPAYLWYASRLQQLPLALFSIAIAGALLPPLSRAMKNKHFESYKKYLKQSLSHGFALIFSCTLGIFALGSSALNLIYGRGDFSSAASYESVFCLFAYAIGLLPATFVLLLANGFYAQKKYFIPSMSSVFTVLLNVVLNSLFIFVLNYKTASIALATSISSIFNMCILSFVLTKELGQIFSKELWLSFLKSVICASVAAIVVLLFGFYVVSDVTIGLFVSDTPVIFPREFTKQCIIFFSQAIIFIGTILIMAKVTKNKDLLDLIKKAPFS
jgi:putative peptidoglycan lipid II flippase